MGVTDGIMVVGSLVAVGLIMVGVGAAVIIRGVSVGAEVEVGVVKVVDVQAINTNKEINTKNSPKTRDIEIF